MAGKFCLQTIWTDTIELGVCPILLGQGRSFLPSAARSVHLRLTHHEAFPSGLLVLHYDVEKAAAEQLS